MERGFENNEEIKMKCHVCGSKLRAITTNLPFKANETTIVIMKDLPIYQCDGCSEYLLDDPVLKRVEEIIQNIDAAAELEVIKYAA
jgi:YgiT-type zinc finger domain-containing protein